MANITLTFDNINNSLQVGDMMYYSNLGTNISGIDSTELSNTYLIGPVVSIIDNSIADPTQTDWTIIVNHNTSNPGPVAGDYISFVKDTIVNISSLVGYYARARFVNDSRIKAELFSVGSETSESSK